jgi:F-type H+-transporting ATPase subunit b
MHFDWSTLALQTVNFAILVWLLHRFLYKPVLRVIDARRAEVEKQYADAKTAEAEAKEHLAAAEAERAKIAGEREAVLKAAVAQAEEATKTRAAQAQRDAAALLAESRKMLASEREKVLAEAKSAALDLGLNVARQLLAEAPPAVRTEAWLERVDRHLSALPTPELEGLKRQLANGAGLRVVTASPVPEGTADVWRARLGRSFGDGVKVSFETDPTLIAGAELHFPSAALCFSWKGALTALRTAIDKDGSTR